MEVRQAIPLECCNILAQDTEEKSHREGGSENKQGV